MGNDPQVRRRLLTGLAVVALVAAPILVRAMDDRPASIARLLTPADAALAVATTPCYQVEAPPRDVERDTVYNPETGVIEVWFRVCSTDRHFAIDPRNDPTCGADPVLRTLIEHVQDAAADG